MAITNSGKFINPPVPDYGANYQQTGRTGWVQPPEAVDRPVGIEDGMSFNVILSEKDKCTRTRPFCIRVNELEGTEEVDKTLTFGINMVL